MKSLYLFCVTMLFITPLCGKTIYVRKNATGLNDGTSWTNAFKELNIALPTAQYGDEIWVAAGTYSPYIPNGVNSFFMVSGVRLLGGFSGNEINSNERNWLTNTTILTGIGEFPWGNTNVLYCEGTDSTTIVDGFTIRDGWARPLDGAMCDSVPNLHICYGGGVYVYNNSPDLPTFLTLRNCRLIDNEAGFGSGLAANFLAGSGGLTVKNCYFKNNSYEGGAMYIFSNQSCQYKVLIDSCLVEGNTAFVASAVSIINYTENLDLTISHSNFHSNTATWNGGTISIQSEKTIKSITIANCFFEANATGLDLFWPGSGGALLGRNFKVLSCVFKNNKAYVGAAITGGDLIIENSLFLNNTAVKEGGAIRIFGKTYIINSTFFGNHSGDKGGAIRNIDADADTIINCLFAGNRADGQGDWISSTGCNIFVDHSYLDATNCEALQDGLLPLYDTLTCGNNLYFNDIDPMLRDTASGDFRLTGCSPLLNKGDASWITRFDLTKDLAGNARITDDLPDIGAYETPAFSAVSGFTNISCYGASDGIAAAVPSGGFAPYSYTWESGQQGGMLIGLVSGQYTVTVYDDDLCSDTLEMFIGQPDSMQLNVVVQNAAGPSDPNGSISVLVISGGTAGFQYLWNTGNQSNMLNSLSPGFYTVTITDSHFCTTELTYEVKFTSGTTEEFSHERWVLFPNPAFEWLSIRKTGNVSEWSYRLFSLNGDVLNQGQFNNEDEIRLYVGDLPKGVYALKISSSSGQNRIFKVLLR